MFRYPVTPLTIPDEFSQPFIDESCATCHGYFCWADVQNSSRNLDVFAALDGAGQAHGVMHDRPGFIICCDAHVLKSSGSAIALNPARAFHVAVGLPEA